MRARVEKGDVLVWTKSWGAIFVGAHLVFPGQYPMGHVPWDCPGSFRARGQHLTTLDTLLVRKLFWKMSWDKLVLLYLRWYIFDWFICESMRTLWYVSLHTSSLSPRILSQHVRGVTVPIQNNMFIKFYIPQCTLDYFRTKTMVTPCQKKRATCFYVLYR